MIQTTSLTLGRRLQAITLAIVSRCTSRFAGIFNPYRPELHYMRGPGPKWHAARARRHGR